MKFAFDNRFTFVVAQKSFETTCQRRIDCKAHSTYPLTKDRTIGSNNSLHLNIATNSRYISYLEGQPPNQSASVTTFRIGIELHLGHIMCPLLISIMRPLIYSLHRDTRTILRTLHCVNSSLISSVNACSKLNRTLRNGNTTSLSQVSGVAQEQYCWLLLLATNLL